MTTLREAAEASLGALKELRQKYGEYACRACDNADVAIIKLCAALEESNPKPLAEWQINDLIEDLNTVDEVHGWSFRQGVYAAEKHHGIGP